jgi:hypothetical protein
MDWASDKKGNAVKEDDSSASAVKAAYFQEQKEKILAQVKARISRDRTHLLCSITGNPKVGKTGLALDCRTQEEIDKGMKILVLDYDNGAEPTWDACWSRDENIIIYNPNEIRADGAVDWEATFKNGNSFVEYAKELIEEGNVKAFILDGVDKTYEGSSDVLRDLLVKQQVREGSIIHPSDSVRVSPLDWKIRNRVYNRQLDLVCALECDRFLITHMKPLYDNINVPVPIGEAPDWHKSTPARFNQMLHIRKEVKEKHTNYMAILEASKTNPKLVGQEWIIFTTNGDNEWFGVSEVRGGTL